MSHEAAEHHLKAAEHHEHAARHHKEAARHHEAGKHEVAAHHTHLAHGHHQHAMHHAAEAAKFHIEHYSDGFQVLEFPSTGIVASEDFEKALARIAVVQGANIMTRAEVRRPEPLRGGVCALSKAGKIEGWFPADVTVDRQDRAPALLGADQLALFIAARINPILRDA